MNNKQRDFVFKVRNALNENLADLPFSTTERLALARKAALSHKKNEASKRRAVFRQRFAGLPGGYLNQRFSLFARLGMAVPAIVLITGLTAIYQVEKHQRISDLAELDALVLTDELPLSAYVDHGFNAFLARQGE